MRFLWICFLGLVAFAAPTAEASLRGVYAHRGASFTHPENTIAAYQEAVRLGAQGVEMDVRETRDGYLVLMHDSTVNRTTDGRGAVSSMTLAEIKKLDAGIWKGPRFAGERVPLFEEGLAQVPPNMVINVHVKAARAVAKIATLVSQLGLQDQAFLAVSRADIAVVREIDPTLKTIDMTRASSNKKYIDKAIKAGATGIQFVDTWGMVSRADVQRAKAAGLVTNFCCVDKASTINELFDDGIDFVLANDAETALKVYRSRP